MGRNLLFLALKEKLGTIIDRNIGFQEKTPFFRRKLAKIAENSDQTVDPILVYGRLDSFRFSRRTV
jgi:hypothetical protein